MDDKKRESAIIIKLSEKEKEQAFSLAEKNGYATFTSFFRAWMCGGTKKELSLSDVVDFMGNLDVDERLEITRQLYEASELQKKLRDLNRSLIESVA
jgi:hypothetical protein